MTEDMEAKAVQSDDGRTSDAADLRAKVNELEAENVHLRGLLKLTPDQARRPAPAQTAIFDVTPGAVSGSSDPGSTV